MSRRGELRLVGNPEDLTITADPHSIELTEEDLGRISAGAADIFLRLGDIKGESN